MNERKGQSFNVASKFEKLVKKDRKISKLGTKIKTTVHMLIMHNKKNLLHYFEVSICVNNMRDMKSLMFNFWQFANFSYEELFVQLSNLIFSLANIYTYIYNR